MAKAMKVRLTDEAGNYYHWTIRHMPRVVNCTIGKTRIISGWEFTDQDGYARFAEGNWNDLVAMAQMVASNYGLTTNLS